MKRILTLMLMSGLTSSLAIAQTAANSAQSREHSSKSPSKSRSSDEASRSKGKDIHDENRAGKTKGKDKAQPGLSQEDEEYRLQLFSVYG